MSANRKAFVSKKDHSDSPSSAQKRYIRSEKLGEGTYAIVHKAIDRQTGKTVALKRIKASPDGQPDISATRELTTLQNLPAHPNILALLDVFMEYGFGDQVKQEDNGVKGDASLCLVLEYHPYDLEMLIKDRRLFFTEGDIKSWMLMILRSVEHMHQHGIMHRVQPAKTINGPRVHLYSILLFINVNVQDLKPNNYLIAEDGMLKLADYGLARSFDKLEKMTPTVVTRWYRPPELLLGARWYGPGVDLWSVGCIFAELMLRVPFLPGNTDVNQLTRIYHALGTPTPSEWPVLKKTFFAYD